LSIIEDERARRDLRELARRYNKELVADRGMDMEAQVLEIIRDMLASSGPRLVIKDIASWFADRHGANYERKISPHWVGRVIRKKLQLKTERGGDGAYEIPLSERSKLGRLYQKYGIVIERAADSPESQAPPAPDPSAGLNF